jgi:deoxyribodipyrimidine photo-lyase
MFKKYQTKFFLILRNKTDSVNSRSLNEKLVSQWINGATDSDFINNMLELKQTGFMSNRGRQNVASYFVTSSIWTGVLVLPTLNHN